MLEKAKYCSLRIQSHNGKDAKITAYEENDYCFYYANRQPFLEKTYLTIKSRPKLQNTNCNETLLLAAATRHRHQTSGHLRANNNNSGRFFKFVPLNGKCFISSVLSRL